MFYDRKIKYVNVYEDGEKGQSAGFIKMEARDDMVSMQVQVAGLRHTDTYNCPMVLIAGEKEFVIGELQLERGKGIKEFNGLHLTDMGSQIGYEELEEIQIRTAGSRLLRCIVREHVREAEISGIEEVIPKAPIAERTLVEAPSVERGIAEASVVEVSVVETLITEDAIVETSGMEEMQIVVMEETDAENFGNRDAETEEAVAGKSEAELLKEAFLAEKRLREGEGANLTEQEPKQNVEKPTQPQNVRAPQPVDKWQQLQAIYPHIRPFEDYREYLMMKPQDFVILPQKYFSLADNSFLLHGYYNYDHLILSKEKRPEGEQMYIGVPGNFYDKEKQVAIMFGFESFEGKREPAGMGDFGYYMIPVEI